MKDLREIVDKFDELIDMFKQEEDTDKQVEIGISIICLGWVIGYSKESVMKMLRVTQIPGDSFWVIGYPKESVMKMLRIAITPGDANGN